MHPFPRKLASGEVIAVGVPSAPGRRKGWMPRLGLSIVTLFGLFGGSMGAARAEESSAQRADRLKASYLLNFVKFIEWPAPAPANPLTVCFDGGQGVLDALASGIENKLVGERHLVVRSLSKSETPVGCDVLYLDAAQMQDGVRAANTGEAPILTVSDAKDFVRSGGMIEFFTDANHLRFNINVGSAQKAGLRISASLLQLAVVVEHGKPK